MGRRYTPKGILRKLKTFPKHTTVQQTPKRVLYYTDGIDFMAHECKAWLTIMYVKPIMEILINDTDGVLYVTLEKLEVGGTKVSYHNSDGVELGDDVYRRQTFVLEELKLLYTGGVLMLPNEYNKEWFTNRDIKN